MTYSVTTLPSNHDAGRAAPIYTSIESAEAHAARQNARAAELGLKTTYSVYPDPHPHSPTDIARP